VQSLLNDAPVLKEKLAECVQSKRRLLGALGAAQRPEASLDTEYKPKKRKCKN
jgi:hypothetical protein